MCFVSRTKWLRSHGHSHDRVAESLRLGPESGFGAGAKAPFVAAQDGLVVRFTRSEHVKYDARQFVRSCRNRRRRSQFGPHSTEKVAERGLAPEQRVRRHAEC